MRGVLRQALSSQTLLPRPYHQRQALVCRQRECFAYSVDFVSRAS